jgi:hypothetical protein
MMANDEAGARHLANNEENMHYSEGPAEKLEGWLKKYRSEEKKGTAKDLSAWLADVSKSKNSKIGQILNCAETKKYLEDLEGFSPHFMVDDFYSSKFCVEYLHKVNGGVSGTIFYDVD